MSAGNHNEAHFHRRLWANCVFGTTKDVCTLEPFAAKEAFGFAVSECDGHDMGSLKTVFESLPVCRKANVVICHIRGAGIRSTEHNLVAPQE